MLYAQKRRRTVPGESDQAQRRQDVADSGDEAAEDDDVQDETDQEVRPEQGMNPQQLAKKLVRYAIACEYSRTAIRRDGIKERVLGDHGRSFKKVLRMAQEQLRQMWGMELRELPARDKITLREKRQAMKSQTQQKAGSGIYVLSTTLPEPYRSASLLRPSKTPSAELEARYAAFYTMVVSVIYLNGGELSDQKLQRYLARLNADLNVGSEKTDVVLKRMERQYYVVKNVETAQDGEHVITWTVGPRGKEEIGLDGVVGMVREVYGGSNDDLETKLRASLGIKRQLPVDGANGADRIRDDSQVDGMELDN